MIKRNETVEMPIETLEEMLRDAGHEGAQETVQNLPDRAALDRASRVEAGLITMQDICALYGVTDDTVRNWGIEPIEYPGRQNLYRVEDLPHQITD